MVDGAANRTVDSTRLTEEADMSTANIRQNSIAAVCEALGVPQKDWPLFSRRSAGPLTPRAVDALNQYVDVMIADRCRKPTDDLLSNLIQLEVDGEALTVDDIHNFVAALVTGAD
jgi:cytochrome P450